MEPVAPDNTARLKARTEEVEDNIRRADGKAGNLLAAGAVLGPTIGLITASGHAEPVTVAVTAALLAAAMIAAVLTIRPRTRNDDKASWPHWAQLDGPEEVDGALERAADPDVAKKRLISLSQLTERKMTALRWASDLTIATVLALCLAAVLTVF